MSLAENKKTVVAFFRRTFNEKDPRARRVATSARTTSSTTRLAADGADGFLAFVRASQQRAPKLSIDIRRVIAEGDHVVLHTRFSIPGAPDRSMMDIFRLENGVLP
jgi:predicted SnoaL-like aldol condensation-catalyzing enzyme